MTRAIDSLIDVAAHAAADLHSVVETMPDSQLRQERQHRVTRIFECIFATRREIDAAMPVLVCPPSGSRNAMNHTVEKILRKQVESLRREAARLGDQRKYLLNEAEQVAESISAISVMVNDIESEMGRGTATAGAA